MTADKTEKSDISTAHRFGVFCIDERRETKNFNLNFEMLTIDGSILEGVFNHDYTYIISLATSNNSRNNSTFYVFHRAVKLFVWQLFSAL